MINIIAGHLILSMGTNVNTSIFLRGLVLNVREVTLKEKGTKPIILTPIKKMKIDETTKGNPDKFKLIRHRPFIIICVTLIFYKP
jgi:hypothetical protein